MRVLFVSKNQYLPQLIGGAEWSIHHFTNGLGKMGHSVAVLSMLRNEGWIGFQNKIRRRISKKACPPDSIMGYSTYRGWDLSRGLKETVDEFNPDVVVVAGIGAGAVGLAMEAIAMGFPVIYIVMDVSFHSHGGPLTDLKSAVFIANSQFTASRLKEQFGIASTIIRPPIDSERCKVSHIGRKVVLINPSLIKGGLVALEMAEARKDIPFIFYESRSQVPDIKERARRAGNIEWRPAVLNPKKIYQEARIILMPSQCEEAWGMVASEAHCSGIPVLGSDIGGLSEAIGPGGVRVKADAPLIEWLSALEKLWCYSDEWLRVSREALAYSERNEIQLDYQISSLDSVLNSIGLGERHAA